MTIECKESHQISSIKLQERLVEKDRVGLLTHEVYYLRLGVAHIETLQDQELTESDGVQSQIIHTLVVVLYIPIDYLLKLLLDFDFVAFRVTPAEVGQVEGINFQVAELIQRVHHQVLSKIILKSLFCCGSKLEDFNTIFAKA